MYEKTHDVQMLQSIAVVALIAFALIAHISRGRRLLERWPERNGHTIVSSERRFLMKGPFIFRSGENNAVYHIVVRDVSGITKQGYARCGSF